MKKGLFTLLILVMAFGNVSFAQLKANLKLNATQHVLKHYGVRDENTVVPETAIWETTNGEQYRTVYTYDEYDYYLIEEHTKIDEGEGWKDYYMITYEYDFNGNVLEAVAMSAYETGEMENEARASYSYDGELLSEVIYQEWEDGDWVNETKEVHNYNGDVSTVLYWDWNGTNWSSDELYTYTRSGNTIELLMQYMQGGAWQNEEKQIFTLNFDEKVTEILEQDWVGNTWVNDELTTYSYEDGDVFTAKDFDVWTGEYWRNEYHFIYVYDGNGNAKQGDCYYVGDGSLTYADNDIEMSYGYSAKSNEYYGFSVEVEYVDLTSVNENVSAASFKVYPVPAENELFIQTEDFQKAEIYSVTGQKLMESLQDRINVGELSSGLYIIKVYDLEGNCDTQRFVVK
jgi:hypothetical protein